MRATENKNTPTRNQHIYLIRMSTNNWLGIGRNENIKSTSITCWGSICGAYEKRKAQRPTAANMKFRHPFDCRQCSLTFYLCCSRNCWHRTGCRLIENNCVVYRKRRMTRATDVIYPNIKIKPQMGERRTANTHSRRPSVSYALNSIPFNAAEIHLQFTGWRERETEREGTEEKNSRPEKQMWKQRRRRCRVDETIQSEANKTR